MVSAGMCFGGKGRLHFSGFCILHWPSPSQSCRQLHSTVAQWIHLAARRRTRTQLMSRRTGSEPTAQISLPKTSGLQIHPTWTLGLPCMGSNIGSVSQAPSETGNSRQTEGSPAGDLRQPTSGTNRQSCQGVLKATEGLCWTFTVTSRSWLCYFCLNISEHAKIARWKYCYADNFRKL